MNKLFASSVNPEKLSLTIKGLLTGLIPLFILFAQFKGVSLVEIEIESMIDSIGAIIMAISGIISAMITFAGLVRKIVVKFE